jgi:hypothetical protein
MAEAVQHSQDDILSGDDHVSPVAEDQRTAARFTLLIRTAKLLTSRGEFLCVVRDASSIGVSVRLFHELPGDPRMLLEMPNGDRHEIAVVWKREGAAGFRFSQPIDTRRIIEGGGRFARRPVRLRLQVPAHLSFHGRSFDAVVRDLSQQGAKIECSERLALEQKLRLEAESLPPIQAKVRWRRGAEYGLVFEDTFQFAELAQLANELQRGVDPLVPPEEVGKGGA